MACATGSIIPTPHLFSSTHAYRVDVHPPGQKAMQAFEDVINCNIESSRRRSGRGLAETPPPKAAGSGAAATPPTQKKKTPHAVQEQSDKGDKSSGKLTPAKRASGGSHAKKGARWVMSWSGAGLKMPRQADHFSQAMLYHACVCFLCSGSRSKLSTPEPQSRCQAASRASEPGLEAPPQTPLEVPAPPEELAPDALQTAQTLRLTCVHWW